MEGFKAGRFYLLYFLKKHVRLLLLIVLRAATNSSEGQFGFG